MNDILSELWKSKEAWQMLLSKSTDIAGQAAMKSALLINGGAAVAILAFIGQIFNSLRNCEIIHSLKFSMIFLYLERCPQLLHLEQHTLHNLAGNQIEFVSVG